MWIFYNLRLILVSKQLILVDNKKDIYKIQTESDSPMNPAINIVYKV